MNWVIRLAKNSEINNFKNLLKLSQQELQFLKDRVDNVTEENVFLSKNSNKRHSRESSADGAPAIGGNGSGFHVSSLPSRPLQPELKKEYDDLLKACQGYRQQVDQLMEEKEQLTNQNLKRQKLNVSSKETDEKIKQLTSDLQIKMLDLSTLENKLVDSEKENLELKNKERKLVHMLKDLKIQLSQLQQTQQLQQKQEEGRVLELKDNPTAKHYNISKKLLDQLRKENTDLLSKTLAGQNQSPSSQSHQIQTTVPISVYERMTTERQQLTSEIQGLNKRLLRLKEMYGKKSSKFMDLIFKVLGYKIEFLSDNKIKVIPKLLHQQSFKSTSRKSSGNRDNDSDDDVDNDNHANANSNGYIIVELNKKKIKLNKDHFRNIGKSINLDNLIQFWIEDKCEISCFFNALNLELYESLQNKI
ncbi:unnamed protein product [Ambrosiozyma monospora]|uniref:Unnamed protein product n=1 Tax=Ambrosiozyma monospora TaxID=43982 RepID=A0ACB5T9W4_AMBMO|nr:unnamed protein product [Ambrosiozyma monospora]